MLNEGNYYAKILGGSAEESDAGKPFIKVELEIGHEANRGQWVAMDKPEKKQLYLYLSEKAWKHSQAKLEAMQFNGDFVNVGFAATGIEVICKHEIYEGKTREKWDLAKWGVKEAKPLDKPSALRMAELWKSAGGKQAEPKSAPASQPPMEHVPPGEMPPPSGDEIPF